MFSIPKPLERIWFPSCLPFNNGVLSSGIQRPEREANHLFPANN